MFIHYVNFFLSKDAPADTAATLIADCQKYLASIESVKQLWVGRPAMTPREVVDNSYDVGLCVVFDDVAGHNVIKLTTGMMSSSA